MKVKMLRNPSASFDCPLCEGQEGEVDGSVGDALVKAGVAVQLEQPKPIQAVPSKPQVAESKPSTIAGSKPANEKKPAPKVADKKFDTTTKGKGQ